jgi:hypothetical protein
MIACDTNGHITGAETYFYRNDRAGSDILVEPF